MVAIVAAISNLCWLMIRDVFRCYYKTFGNVYVLNKILIFCCCCKPNKTNVKKPTRSKTQQTQTHHNHPRPPPRPPLFPPQDSGWLFNWISNKIRSAASKALMSWRVRTCVRTCARTCVRFCMGGRCTHCFSGCCMQSGHFVELLERAHDCVRPTQATDAHKTNLFVFFFCSS